MATQAEADAARNLLAATIDGFLSLDPPFDDLGLQAPAEVRLAIEQLCAEKGGYRDAALTLLAFPVSNDRSWDVTDRFERDRGVSNWLGEFLAQRNIPAVRSALQNATFRHGFTHDRIGSEPLKVILNWASDPATQLKDIRAAFVRIARLTASTARAVTPMPLVYAPSLTYLRVIQIIEAFLAEPSGGAAEQYTFAGLKMAEVEAIDDRLRVVTKNINAADAGRTAGDVQVVRGQAEVVDAYEVSAAGWNAKVGQAVAMIQTHGLSRAHIVAAGTPPTPGELEAAIRVHALTIARDHVDISVLSLSQEIRSLVARLSVSGRLRALNHIWGLLATFAPDATLRFVHTIEAAGVCAD